MTYKGNIGVFDSGVGGITVLKQIVALLPNENIIYYADNENSPYGNKTEEEVYKISKNIVDFLIKKDCKIIVIACNTATAVSLEKLKKDYNVPIIGVINSGSKMAISLSENNKIGVLSTVLTANNNAYRKEFKKLSNIPSVYQVGCPEFCEMIENGWESYENGGELIEKYLSLLPEDIDTLILGCTHYPIIMKEFKKIFYGKNIINPAKSVAIDVFELLKKLNLLNVDNEKSEKIFFVKGDIKNFKEISEKYLDMSLENIEMI